LGVIDWLVVDLALVVCIVVFKVGDAAAATSGQRRWQS
jgi:hypothetical protein